MKGGYGLRINRDFRPARFIAEMIQYRAIDERRIGTVSKLSNGAILNDIE